MYFLKKKLARKKFEFFWFKASSNIGSLCRYLIAVSPCYRLIVHSATASTIVLSINFSLLPSLYDFKFRCNVDRRYLIRLPEHHFLAYDSLIM